MSTTPTVYTPEAVAEVHGVVLALEGALAGDLEPWHRQQAEEALADARAWLQGAQSRA